MKYFHISTIQNDTKELGLLIESLKISSLTNAEMKIIKNLIVDFMKTLRPDLHVISESSYVDRTFRDSYYDYYSTKHSDFYRNCIRLSFFDSEFNPNVDLNDVDNIKNNYLGFLILRPLKTCIGRNVISPKAKISTYSDIRICSVEVDTSCLGVKLKAKGFPHASQDSETMTCAQTTIWSVLEYYGNKYTLYKPTFLTSSRTFRNHIANSKIISNEERLALLQICMPKFVWVTELSTPDEFNDKQISTLLILDATGSKVANLSKNIIFLLSKSYYYRYDDISHNIKGTLTSFPQTLEMFPGNLE